MTEAHLTHLNHSVVHLAGHTAATTASEEQEIRKNALVESCLSPKKKKKDTAATCKGFELDQMLKKGKEDKIVLTLPDDSSDGFGSAFASHDDQVSTIAVLNEITVLITQADSNFRQILWRQDTETMQMAVKFAPMIRDYVISQADQQAKATEEDAAKETQAGTGILITCGVGILAGGAQAYAEFPKNPESVGLKDSNTLAGQGARSEEQALLREEQQQTAAAARQPRTMVEKLQKASPTFKSVMKGMEKILQTQQGMYLTGQGIIKLTVEAPHDIAKAKYQRSAGQSEGNARATEGFQSFYSLATDRGEKTVGAADQNHATALNTLKGAVDTTTNAMVSAFNKI